MARFLTIWLLFPVGAPIHVKKAVANPKLQQVNRLHKKYVQGLITLFEEQKHRYGVPKSVKLKIVWFKSNLEAVGLWHL